MHSIMYTAITDALIDKLHFNSNCSGVVKGVRDSALFFFGDIKLGEIKLRIKISGQSYKVAPQDF